MPELAIAFKERPILFSGAMVRVVIEGIKTQTRRVMKPQPFLERSEKGNWWLLDRSEDGYGRTNSAWEEGREPFWAYCHYGKPGDRLWVRETHYRWGHWTKNGKTDKGVQRWKFIALDRRVVFAATDSSKESPTHRGDDGWWKRPAIFMPRWASRLTLEIVSVKVERVQQISEADAKAEGSGPDICHCDRYEYSLPGCEACANNYRRGYEILWDSINEKRGFGWAKNPWVWAIEFRRADVTHA